MITFLKTWISQIIVAVIIGTIIELILPSGNNKKYIKMIIGMYILFTIIQPVVTKIAGNNLEITNFNYKKYFDEDIMESSMQDFENNNSKLIKQAYINNIKENIGTKIKQKGYDLINCSIEILDNENEEDYGIIQSINLTIKNIESKTKKDPANAIEINNVEIEIDNNTDNNLKGETSNISDEKKIEIIEFLAEEYAIEKTAITIN